MGSFDDSSRVGNPSRRARVLDEHRCHVLERLFVLEVDHVDLQTRRLCSSAHHADRLGQQIVTDQEPRRWVLPVRPAYQCHRFCGGGCLVKQRSSRRGEPRKVCHHGLEVQERLEPPLRDFGLVGGVGGVPGRVLEDVTPDHRGCDRAVVAEPDHRHLGVVALGDGAQGGERFALTQRPRELKPFRGDDRGGEGNRHQRVERVVAEPFEHLLLVGGVRADVALGEGGDGLE